MFSTAVGGGAVKQPADGNALDLVCGGSLLGRGMWFDFLEISESVGWDGGGGYREHIHRQ